MDNAYAPSGRPSLARKFLFAVGKACTRPRSTVSWVIRGHLAKDSVFVSQSYWVAGALPRVPLQTACPGVQDFDVQLPRAFDRTSGKTASITVDEACHLAAIARWSRARKALEIGTSDGNSSLVLAANMVTGATVVTLDLPAHFDISQQASLAFPTGELNLTPRDRLGGQCARHPLGRRVRQVFGDSGSIDWNALGGPFDLVFIDGSHTEEYVRSDSLNAARHLVPAGVIVWHDYGMIADVSMVVDQLAREWPAMRIYAIEGTRLAVALPAPAHRRVRPPGTRATP